MTDISTPQGAPRSLWAFLRDGRAGGHRLHTEPTAPKWGVRRLAAALLLAVLPLTAILGLLAASSARADDADPMKYSFYKVASSTTAFFSTVQEPGSSEQFSGDWKRIIQDPGSAGSLLGYADPNLSDVSGWLASKLSGSSDAIGYDTLLVRDGGDSASYATGQFQGMVDYAYFGAALKGMGLDGTSTGLSLGFWNWLGGGVVMLLYILSGAVDFVFNSVISVLSMLNPFKLFYAGVAAVNPALADGMIGNGSADVGPLSGLVEWIGGWYQVLTSLAWGVMVPIFIAVLLFGLLVFKKLDRGGAIKKLVIRMLFIGLGLPLLGTMYTGMIDSMADASASGNAGSTRVVMSTYVDFENWAMKSRLAVPADATIAWDVNAGSPSGASQAKIRNTTLAINNQTLGLNLNSIVSSGAYDASWANQVMEGKSGDAATNANTFARTVDMLSRYLSGSQVSAASFETIAKGDLTQSSYYAKNAGTTVKDWFEKFTKGGTDLNKENPASNPILAVSSGSGLRADGTTVRTFTSSTSGCSYTGTKITGSDGAPRACNLSPLAMYNYLNTDFDSTSMRMYSSSNVASEATRSIHNSVNQVGTGSMSFLYWLNTVVLLGSFVLIGLGYAFAMLWASIRRSVQIVTSMPFATIGAIAAIAKIVVYSVALVLEVIVTIFVYKLVQEFLTSLPQIIEMPFAAILNNGSGGDMAGFIAFLVNGWGFSLVVTVISIIGLVGFTVLALRVRKGFVKAIEEAVTKIVEKFMDSSVGMPSTGGLTPALAGGLASGAGAAMATRMINKDGAKGAIAPTPAWNAGPGGVTSAGGNTVPSSPGGESGGPTGVITGGDGGPTPGNGDPGTTPALTRAGQDGLAIAREVEIGRGIEANGLSKPGEPRAPQAGDDVMSSVSTSMDATAAGYKAAAAKRKEIVTDGAQAAGHAALAVGRGFAGDGAGAAESGGKAIQKGGSAVASGHDAKQLRADAARSSLDKPNQKHVRAAAAARKTSQAGATVSQVAAAKNGTGQVSAGSIGPSTPAVPASGAGVGATKAPGAAKSDAAPRAVRSAPARATSSAPSRPVSAPKQQTGASSTPPQSPRTTTARQAPKRPLGQPLQRPPRKGGDGAE